jgi:hypothetical protein
MHAKNGHFEQREYRLILVHNEIFVLNEQFHYSRTDCFKKYSGSNKALGSEKGQTSDFNFLKDFDPRS